jgi:hypothetical protein
VLTTGGGYNSHPQQQERPYTNEVRIRNLNDKISEQRRAAHQLKLALLSYSDIKDGIKIIYLN